MRTWVQYKEKKSEKSSESADFSFHFSKIRAFGSLQPQATCDFERFTVEEGISQKGHCVRVP